jgi:RHH-type proline utilization regulon transcriptional repressor/proline dehydrogenase/delta 1-pyrroline-5-carboxylate dehydrogenase
LADAVVLRSGGRSCALCAEGRSARRHRLFDSPPDGEYREQFGASTDYVEAQDVGALLAPPRPTTPHAQPAKAGFLNVPLLDFSEPAVQASFQDALRDVAGDLGAHFRLDIEGGGGGKLEVQTCINPARASQVLGYVELGEIADAERTVANAARAFDDWRETPAQERARLCMRAADLMSERRQRLAALEVFEVGKNWREADADVAEAIDYLRYYAQQMLALAAAIRPFAIRASRIIWSMSRAAWPVVIAPWNFPLAILTGMTAAALVSGNPAIMKPAAPSTLLAVAVAEHPARGRFPRNVCQLIPGSGTEVGAFLVDHRRSRSSPSPARAKSGCRSCSTRPWCIPDSAKSNGVVCEMGGKNAIIVDRDADLDEAVLHTLQSAFGYQGRNARQLRASSSSVRRTIGLCRGSPKRSTVTSMARPTIRRTSSVRSLRSCAEAHRRLRRGGARRRTPGVSRQSAERRILCSATIFTGIEAGHRLAREEIFGPVLAVMRAGEFGQALEMALDSDFALTGGVLLPAARAHRARTAAISRGQLIYQP